MLNEYHWTPQQWASMNRAEQAIVVASIEVRQADEKKQQKEAERKARSKRYH